MLLKKYEPRYKKGILDLTKKYDAGVGHLEYLLLHNEAKVILMFNEKNKLRGFTAGIPKEGKFFMLYCLGKTEKETIELDKLVKDILKDSFKSIIVFDHENKIYQEEVI